MTANEYGIVFWGGEDILKLVMMIVQKQITELTLFKTTNFEVQLLAARVGTGQEELHCMTPALWVPEPPSGHVTAHTQ